MFDRLISISLNNKLLVFAGVIALVWGGIIALMGLPVDAVPDITNNQVQVVTSAPTLAAQEMEQIITFPIEAVMANLPGVTDIRSISRYGLSVVTVVFDEDMDLMRARQFVGEQIKLLDGTIPPELGKPEMMPITTGLGEVYQYVLTVDSAHAHLYNDMELRTVQDWIVKRQLAGIEGIIETSSFGGRLKQYEVAVDPALMLSRDITMEDVCASLQRNNANSGGSYIESGTNAFYIRTEGRAENLDALANTVVEVKNGVPVRIGDVAKVGHGSAQRYGALTMDGKGEVVGGITLMLKGGNSSKTIDNVKDRMEKVQRTLPQGITIYPYLDRSVLVGKTMRTVTKNLIEGGLVVIFVLVVMLGNLRAGAVVASVIPLAMLFAIIMMRVFGVSANLMSLGAIDFGIVVDGAVIIVEGVLHFLHVRFKGQRLTSQQMDGAVATAAGQIYRSAAFGVLIILVVFVPVFTLEGVEGKTFMPMAQTVSFAILGSLILSLTYVPVMSALVLSRHVSDHDTWSDRFMALIAKAYGPSLGFALKRPLLLITATVAGFAISIGVFMRMGAEFIPTLEEGDLAMQMTVPIGSSLSHTINRSTEVEKILRSNFPEVKHVVSKIGTGEVPTDPMGIEDTDIMILLKEQEEWTTATDREELIGLMKEKLQVVEGASFEFSQPIQLRFNELMTGSKTDIAIKIFGEDLALLKDLGDSAATLISDIQGAGDVKVEQTEGLRQLSVTMDRRAMSLYGISADAVNLAIRAAYAGEVVGSVYENERRFDLAVRLNATDRGQLNLDRIMVHAADGSHIPLSRVAHVRLMEGPSLISRQDAKRRVAIGVNVRDRDVASLVADIQTELDARLPLPPGYTVSYGGQFENLQHASQRLLIAVPVALVLILLLLYISFGSVREALIIFSAVPLAAVGGILALWLRGMPFSISAGIGFIALFGVAVLNGLVLVNEFIRLRREEGLPLLQAIRQGADNRLRPVLTTALVASLGFLPMAISTSNGAEVQRPLATVVIGGLVTSTLLTLMVLPVIYLLAEKRRDSMLRGIGPLAVIFLFLCADGAKAQQGPVDVDELVRMARESGPEVIQARLERQEWDAEAHRAYVLPSTEAVLQYGQVSYSGPDYNIQIMQGLGRPWAAGAHRRWAVAGQQGAGARAAMAQAEAELRVRLAYNGLAEAQAAATEAESWAAALDQALRATEAQTQAGELNGLDRQAIVNVVMAAATEAATFRQRAKQAEAELRYLTGLPPDRPLDDVSMPSLVLSQRSDSISATLLATFRAEVQQAHLAEKVIATKATPMAGVGYFNQSINGVSNNQGAMVSLSVPILPSGRRHEQRIQQLRAQQAETRLSDQRLVLLTELTNARAQLAAADTLMGLYQRAGTPDATALRHSLFQQHSSGLIGPIDLAMQATLLMRNTQDRLKQQAQRNASILIINHLTK